MNTFESLTGRPAIGLLDDIEVLVQNSSEAIEMFNRMIAKVKTRAAVKDTSGIILTK